MAQIVLIMNALDDRAVASVRNHAKGGIGA